MNDFLRDVAGQPRILIVDDEAETARSLSLSLRSRGYHVEAAGSAGEAIRLLGRGSPFDLVLTDYAMPGTNGVQFLLEIRAGWGNLPVILMTAYGSKDVLVDALRNRCDGFIEKPFTIEALVAEINRVNQAVRPESAAQGVGELMPMLVHQLNNPLNVIMGVAQLGMLDHGDADPVKKKLAMILEAGKKIRRINQEILDLGRGMDDAFEMVDVRQLLSECLDSFDISCSLRGIAIERRLNDGASSVSGSRFALEQMFCNLIANGIEAVAGRRTGMLTVRLFRDSARGAAVIDINDNGCGMSPETLGRIFTPYYTTKEEGTGLGLAVVRRVVTAHRGDIAVSSAVDEGTSFTVTLPLLVAAAAG